MELRNIYSQFGEDGVIEYVMEILRKAECSDKWCLDVGAWDGLHLSNTANLIIHHEFSAVLIEADKERFHELSSNFSTKPVTAINMYVNFEGQDTLDKVLSRTDIPTNFDFLSIDIDGCDFYIFESLTKYRPKLICIEFNPTIPNSVEYVNPRNFSVKHGSSAKSIAMLAKAKNYKLLTSTTCNLFLIASEYSSLLFDNEPSLDQVRISNECEVFLFSTYDGTIKTSQEMLLPWHNLAISDKNLQILPKIFRKYPGDYGPLRRKFYFFYSRFIRR